MNRGDFIVCFKLGSDCSTTELRNVEFEEMGKSIVFTDIDTKEFVYAFYYENLIYVKPLIRRAGKLDNDTMRSFADKYNEKNLKIDVWDNKPLITPIVTHERP